MNLLEAQLRQAREAASKMAMQCEVYARVATILAVAIETATDVALVRVDGRVAIRKAALDEVPKKWRIDLVPTVVKPVEAPQESDAGEAVVVVKVVDAPVNGQVIGPPPPRLVL